MKSYVAINKLLIYTHQKDILCDSNCLKQKTR